MENYEYVTAGELNLGDEIMHEGRFRYIDGIALYEEENEVVFLTRVIDAGVEDLNRTQMYRFKVDDTISKIVD